LVRKGRGRSDRTSLLFTSWEITRRERGLALVLSGDMGLLGRSRQARKAILHARGIARLPFCAQLTQEQRIVRYRLANLVALGVGPRAVWLNAARILGDDQWVATSHPHDNIGWIGRLTHHANEFTMQPWHSFWVRDWSRTIAIILRARITPIPP
jgi:hypothetical protein